MQSPLRSAVRPMYVRKNRTHARSAAGRNFARMAATAVLCLATSVAGAATDRVPTDDEALLANMLSKLAPATSDATPASHAALPASHTQTNPAPRGLSQPSFVQPASFGTSPTNALPAYSSSAASRPQSVIPAESYMISDRRDPQTSDRGNSQQSVSAKVTSAKASGSNKGESPSRWAALWSQFSNSNDAEQRRTSPTTRVLTPTAPPAPSSTQVRKLKTGLLGQLLGLSEQRSPRLPQVPSVAASSYAVQPASAVSPATNQATKSNAAVRQAAASQPIESSAGSGGAPQTASQTAARAASSRPQDSPALPGGVHVAEQQLTQNAATGAATLWHQLAATGDRESTADHRSIQQPSPSASPNHQPTNNGPGDDAWAGLWRPMTMTNPGSATAGTTPSSATGGNAAANASARLPEAERVPRLLRPMFYATNDRTSSQQAFASQSAAAVPSRSIEERVGDASLFRQLSLTANQDLNAGPLSSANGSSNAWQDTWYEPWLVATSQFAMTNEPIRALAPPNATPANNAIQQVAFLQENAAAGGGLQPDRLDLPNGNSAEGDADGEGGAEEGDGDGESKEGALAEADKLGAEPEDNSLQFLRTQTVLLEPGETRFDIGLEYTLSENDFPRLFSPAMDTVAVDEVHVKGRELAVPMELRYGLLKRVQLFLQVPVGWSNTQVSFTDVGGAMDAYANDGGLGDISWGSTVQIQDGSKDCPYLIGTFAVTAPTGGDPFTGVIAPATTGPSLGNGFWSVAGNLTWIRVYDPIVVYYGLGMRRHFERTYVGLEIGPGPEYNYTLGMGFSVNEKVTLSTQFFGAYIEDLKVDGDRLEGSNQEPLSLRLAATISKPKNRLVEPFVTFGLTDDATAANFGITWTF